MAAVSPAIWMWTSILEYPRTKWLRPDPETDSTPTDVTHSRIKHISSCCICSSSISHHVAACADGESDGSNLDKPADECKYWGQFMNTACMWSTPTAVSASVPTEKWDMTQVVSVSDSPVRLFVLFLTPFTLVRLSYCEIIDYDTSLFQLVILRNSHWSAQRFPFAFCWLLNIQIAQFFHTVCFIIGKE